MKNVLIWDGQEFTEIPEKEAKKLEKEDKVQIIAGALCGTQYKHRHEFTGYSTKVMKPAVEAKSVKKKNTKKADK